MRALPSFLPLALLLLAVVSLSACSASGERVDSRKVEEGNRKVARIDKLRASLSEMGVYLETEENAGSSAVAKAMKPVLNLKESTELVEIQTLIREYRSLCDDIVLLINEKDVTYGGNRLDLTNWIEAAKGLDREISELLKSRS